MTEDHGAFKTKRADPRPICRFVIGKPQPLPPCITAQKSLTPSIAELASTDFYGTAQDTLRYPRISLIRSRSSS
jgi:hypothetical protein